MESCSNCARLIESNTDLTQMVQEFGLDVIRLKRTNTVLRTVKGMLYTRIKTLQENADAAFEALCSNTAEAAMGELWGSGKFDCGPQDYQYMVERCIEALDFYDVSHTKPSASTQATPCE